MKKTIIPFLSFLLALCMFIGTLTSCGDSSNQTEATTDDTKVDVTTAESESKHESGDQEITYASEETTVTHNTQEPETSNNETNSVETHDDTETEKQTVKDETDTVITVTEATTETTTETAIETSAEINIETESETFSETDTVFVTETVTESPETTANSEETTDEEKVEVTLPENSREAAMIENANKLANGVQAYFPYPDRTGFAFENHEMYLEYMLSSSKDQQVTALKNKDGHSYVENTMDVYVRMKDSGKTYYASKSTIPTTANLYRFGYYYYEARLEEQVFSDEVIITDEQRIRHNQIFNTNQIDEEHYQFIDNVLYVTNNDEATDPYIIFGKSYAGFTYSAEKYSFLKIKMKADPNCTTGGLVFIIAGNETGFSAKQSVGFTVIPDDEIHEYIIPLHGIEGYEGKLKGLRIDVSGSGASYEIHDMHLLAVDVGDAPTNLALNRSFHVYSDKMHQTIQVATTKETTGIDAIGITTSIAKETVTKLIAVDKDDNKYDDIDSVTDWSTISHVAFDIIDAGIFGYILPHDGTGGTIKVTLDGDNYVVIQERIPENGTIIPSRGEYDQEKGYYKGVVAHNANDFYINHRIYTDSSHDFNDFLAEAYIETNPIPDRLINVASSSTGAVYSGYDTARGIYRFTLSGPSSGFNDPYYKHPNKHYNVNFTIKAPDNWDSNRSIYVMTYTSVGSLESAAILDKEQLMLPIPLEVGKNFSEASGERNIFNINDETYGEVIFPMVLKAGEKNQYTVLNLYQRWGNFPLKQLSWIQFHSPYYHLSTGVTETNCILPWYTTKNSKGLNTLPDYRTMSAPFWAKQPQHNSCGVHQWLIYTDAEGNRVTSENIYDQINSYGPTYADVRMDYISDDGKIKISYTHTEMPQLDENRTFYEMKYEILEDVTINDFRNNFQFYSVYPNNNTGYYTKVGYLGTDNKPHYEEAVMDTKDENGNTVAATPVMYKLGDKYPYFSFFDMDNANPKHQEGYANVAVLIYDSKFVIGGEEADPGFVIWNTTGRKVKLSLDLGDVTLKKGDTFTINAILLPWGSQVLDRDYADPNNPDPDAIYYDTVINEATGEKYMDKNVRAVRENTLINPLKATAVNDCEIIDSVFVPKLKTTNGKTAEFTLTGGNDNVTVRIYGFEKLTSPKVEEFVDGEWIEYRLDSSKNPDAPGYIHYYDGYSVFYDRNGTFSYSFVVTMDQGKARTFRFSVADDFDGYRREPTINEKRPDALDVYVDAVEIRDGLNGGVWVSDTKLSDDERYVSLFGTGDGALNHNGAPVGEGYLVGYSNSTSPVESGHLFAVMYRLPKTNERGTGKFELWTSTVNKNPAEANKSTTTAIEADGEWHVIIVDLTKERESFVTNEFVADENGKYYAQFLRFDFFDKCMLTTDYIDIAFFALDNSMFDIINHLNSGKLDPVSTMTLVEGTKTYELDPISGEKIDNAAPTLESFIHPDCTEFTASALDYASCVDGINGKTLGGGSNSKILAEVPATRNINDTPFTLAYNGKTIADANYNNCTRYDGTNLVISGWTVIDGGVSKYVYSVDSGKTWKDCSGFGLTPSTLPDGHLTNAANRIGKNDNSPFTTADDKTNGLYQGLNSLNPKGITADLSAHVGKTVHVIFAAVPANATDTLCFIAYVTGVKVVAEEKIVVEPTYNDYVKEGSGYSVSDLEFAACIDRVCTTVAGNHVNSNSASVPVVPYNSTPISAATSSDNRAPGTYLIFSGWAIVRGGIEKYVWSADGGNTWHDVELYNTTSIVNLSSTILNHDRLKGLGYTFVASDGTNSMFQSSSDGSVIKGLAANLEAYAGNTVDVIFAAVPTMNNDTLRVLSVATGVQVPQAQ